MPRMLSSPTKGASGKNTRRLSRVTFKIIDGQVIPQGPYQFRADGQVVFTPAQAAKRTVITRANLLARWNEVWANSLPAKPDISKADRRLLDQNQPISYPHEGEESIAAFYRWANHPKQRGAGMIASNLLSDLCRKVVMRVADDLDDDGHSNEDPKSFIDLDYQSRLLAEAMKAFHTFSFLWDRLYEGDDAITWADRHNVIEVQWLVNYVDRALDEIRVDFEGASAHLRSKWIAHTLSKEVVRG